MFITCKRIAGVKKYGGLHVFSRYSLATIIAAKGCDIRIGAGKCGIGIYEQLFDMPCFR